MKSTACIGGAGMLLVAFACNPGLSLDAALEGKRCRAFEPKCLDGYVCNSDRVCVPQEAGSAGAGPLNPDPPSGGTGGAGGSEASGAGMDTMSSDVAAAADAAPPCTPRLLFRDRDGDGFGSDALEDQRVACPLEGWVSKGGDCLDDPTVEHATDVHPEQLGFFADGYPRPDQPGGISFDYDCSGGEEADPNNRVANAAGDCRSASAPTICGSLDGMVPTDRSGGSVNALCGSTMLLTCNMMGAECVTAFVNNAELQFRCH